MISKITNKIFSYWMGLMHIRNSSTSVNSYVNHLMTRYYIFRLKRCVSEMDKSDGVDYLYYVIRAHKYMDKIVGLKK